MAKNIEKILKVIEDKLNITKVSKEETEMPIGNFFLALVFGWLPIMIGIIYLFHRMLKVMFMSRYEQSKHKESYLKGCFNALKYILDGNN